MTGEAARSIGQRSTSLFRCPIRELVPGIALSTAVAITAVAGLPWVTMLVPVPAMVLALTIGIAINPVARQAVFRPGIEFCVKTLLRSAVALLGFRIAFGEIFALGIGTAALVAVAMAMTLTSGFVLARLFRQSRSLGALAGAATAVCGASAALATAAVLPNYKGKEADVAFVVIAVNFLSTAAMVIYPPLCVVLGFDATTTGIMLGATIHDVAQVAGAGYATSEQAGNTAVIVKLFRVLLLFPVVVVVAWWFLRPHPPIGALKKSIPGFALAFAGLCIINTALSGVPSVSPFYEPLRMLIGEISSWGLLIAISALGLGTSIRAVASLGFGHVVTIIGTTLFILTIVTGLLAVSG